MAQSDQVVQDATFPSVRADINDNLAALYSQSSGNSAPSVTVAFQPWVDTSSSPPVWKIRNNSNTAWITVGILDPAGFNAGGVTAIANGGTGATTAALALAALLPSQGGNAGKALVTSGSAASWGTVASGASLQTFTANGTYTPTAGKTTFLVFATGGGGGGGGSAFSASGAGGGGGGTALRLFTSIEMGNSASITVGAAGGPGSYSQNGGSAGGTGGNTIFQPAGTGLAITGNGGSGGSGSGGSGGGQTNSQVDVTGNRGSSVRSGGTSFFAGGKGGGGIGGSAQANNALAGIAGVVLILEW
jgi:hypothetical protein